MSADFEVHRTSKESLRTSVPWFCVEELKEVYLNVFHDDLSIVRKGYKQLLVWKARRPTMPAGIEATFNICEVILQDSKFQESSEEFFLPQLRLTYATTIMRFLNLVLNMTPGKTEKKTMFDLADAVGIPKWIVDIRHDSAHGSVLPDIGVLRSAARFCMDWLKSRYWNAALEMNDLVIKEGELIVSDTEKTIDKVFQCWENFSILKIAGYSSRNQAKHRALWDYVNELANSHKMKEDNPKKIVKLDEALLVLGQKINELLRNRKNHAIKPVFVKKMLCCETFLPSENLLSLFKATKDEDNFPKALKSMWSEVLENMWEAGWMALVLFNLVNIARDSNETALRRHFAVLWLQQILLSIIKVKEYKRVFDAAKSRLDKCTNDEPSPWAIRDAIVAQRPELKGAYDWACLPLPRCVLSKDLLEKALVSPVPPNIHVILPNMLELLDPPLPNHLQDCLRECLSIYCNRRPITKHSSSNGLFTLSDICPPSSGGVELKEGLKTFPDSVTNTSSASPWKRSTDIFSWSQSALGILPWQFDYARKIWSELLVEDLWEKEMEGVV